jgi:hypothetical protein
MKICIFILSMIISMTSFGAVVKGWDKEQLCDLYRVVNDETPRSQDEITVFNKAVYGLSITNMDIDFNNVLVKVDPIINVTLGFNRPLLNEKVFITSQNPDFTFLINQINRKIYLFEKMCIGKNNELIYAKYFPTEETKNN